MGAVSPFPGDALLVGVVSPFPEDALLVGSTSRTHHKDMKELMKCQSQCNDREIKY